MRFVVRNLSASRVNLLMNDYTAGLPSPLAFLGLAESLGRDLNVAPWAARVFPVLHKVHASEGRTKPEMDYREGAFSPVENIEDMVGTVEASLVLDLPGVEDADAVGDAIVCKRLAGGTISSIDGNVRRVANDGRCLNMMKRGYAMVRPDEEERRIISSGDLDQMSEIAEILFPETLNPGRGWIVPVAVGHRLLEDPETVPRRQRTRSPDMPHVFVEPCVGIAEMISVRNIRLTDLDDDNMADRFWQWCCKGSHVVAHPAYHPQLS